MAIKGWKHTQSEDLPGIMFAISNVVFVPKFQCVLLIAKFVATIGTAGLCNQKSLL